MWCQFKILLFFKEKGAVKKLQNIVKDHEERLKNLQKIQNDQRINAELVTKNLNRVDNTILFIRQAVAKQLHWDEIWEMTKRLNFEDGGNIYALVHKLNLHLNQIIVELL